MSYVRWRPACSRPQTGRSQRMERVEESEHHRDIYSHLDREADKTWVHHVADLDRGDEVHSETYDRPVAVLNRVEFPHRDVLRA